MERIPPTKNTFPQHVWRAVYQADNLYSSTALSGWNKKLIDSLEFMELKKCLCKGNCSNLTATACCKPSSPVHLFVIVNAINGDWLTMFAAMIILCEVYNSTLLFPILASDILLFNFANVLIMVASYSNINWHTFRDLYANLVPVPLAVMVIFAT